MCWSSMAPYGNSLFSPETGRSNSIVPPASLLKKKTALFLPFFCIVIWCKLTNSLSGDSFSGFCFGRFVLSHLGPDSGRFLDVLRFEVCFQMADTKVQAGVIGVPVVDETSPDLLKNTPSNIARLEDVIEQCEGRQKYLAQTRSPSDGSDVRWYFCQIPLAENELAASVPRSEVVGKSEFFRFGMRDSLATEASFLQREEELLSLWWKEYAECSEGPRIQVDSKQIINKQSTASTSKASASTGLYEVEEERVGVPVKGGLYEVDLVKRHCFPVYWNGENRRVLRGHWFARKGGLDWLPIREDVAEQLEVAYHNKVWRRRTFQPSGLFAARVDLRGSSLGFHAFFTGEDDTWEAWLNVDPSGFSGIVGYTGNGIKLRRGYSGSHSPKPTQEELRQQKEEEMDDYCSQVPVRHLVFMVHGIGQRLEKSNLVDDVGNFRQITASLAEHHLTSYQLGTQRVLFIPCQWRKGLKLSGEAAVDKCTLDGVRRLRVLLSATVHDVLYYMSPIYCQAIIDSVSTQLNRLYLKFLKRNPGYDGKVRSLFNLFLCQAVKVCSWICLQVSIYGHSLGSVLSYDILCHQENSSSPFSMNSIYKKFFLDEETSPMRSTRQFNNIHSSTNLDNENFNQMNPEEISGRDHNTMVAKGSTLLEHNDIVCEASSLSGSRVVDNVDLEPKIDKDVEHEEIYNSGDGVSLHDGPDRTDNGTHVLSCIPEQMTDEQCDDANKEETIKKLREEVNSLREKLAELRSQSDSTHTRENAVTSMVPDERTQTEDVKTPQSYTPYIKYTKLAFKLDHLLVSFLPSEIFVLG
ncbi:PREDICTED: phospholipase SGR2-like isoform X2 [Tarenaya hassleriana]|uniref:phospholipase SGR2-like isoform X2 n=1 Tax=Tarenaya hassleriana TaxID=28532 RepID=UPI0008FCFE96|nr:PREDICTED: phospholipase SGR2-like isoform X2 [Tarenaya hassleriana]